MEKIAENDIYSAFRAAAQGRENHPAIIYLGTVFSYGKVKKLADALGAALIDMGVAPAQKIMLLGIYNNIFWAGATPMSIKAAPNASASFLTLP